MKQMLAKFLARFLRRETGSVTLEFVIMFPAFITVMLSSVEVGMLTMRHTMLERGLDLAVREIRLGTGYMPQSHGQLKTMICDYAGFLPDCSNTLKLEMKPIDLRSFSNIEEGADCVDVAQPLLPVRTFVAGNVNELMILRACYRFKPLYPLSGLGYALVEDGSGYSKMLATSAFVQEPR
jgi:hypothetical protein